LHRRRLTQDQLRYRSRTQPSDFLRNVPGIMVSQHAGGGKADQYFVRGFDADHGTDVAIFADGVPVNLTSHGHGQGYADTHWMIPETIKSVEVHKGPYAARFGDFYTAGAMEFATLDKIEGPTVWIAAGSSATGPARFDSVDRRLVGMASPSLRRGDRSLIALQIAENDGPYVNPQDFRQGNALVKWADEIGPGTLKLQTTWYMGTWNQSGQVPEGEVAAVLDASAARSDRGRRCDADERVGVVQGRPRARDGLRRLEPARPVLELHALRG
jgi:outer membrane receptor protein involved in Fe transport